MKMYWEDGFYSQQNEEATRVEITEKEHQRLIMGQAEGKIIYTRDDGYPDLKDYEPTDKELYSNEKLDLQHWFDDIYTYKEQKYRRLTALQQADDDSVSANTKLKELYLEAEEKRKRIQELELLLQES